jgi:hypothetical protein
MEVGAKIPLGGKKGLGMFGEMSDQQGRGEFMCLAGIESTISSQISFGDCDSRNETAQGCKERV